MAGDVDSTFRITGWQEETVLALADASKIVAAKVSQQYEGAIEGTSTINYVMCYTGAQRAEFTGYEVMDVTVSGKQGRFVIRHDGRYAQEKASSDWVVVAGSGEGELKGISGRGSFSAGHGGSGEVRHELALP